ncbi:MAG TPA: hypothetical protein VF698_01010 [Thermoanaerobaculia bacterium]|jgi:hypothetical protein
MFSNDKQVTGGSMTMPRRDFIRLGSVAVASVAASNLSAGAIRSIAAPRSGSILSIGFLAAEGEGVTSASRLRSTDRQLADGAKLTIHGYSRPEAVRNEPLVVDVATFFEVDGQAVPFLAASYGANARGPWSSAGGSFTVPTDKSGGVTIGIDRRPSGATRAAAKTGRLATFFSRKRSEAELAVPQLDTLDRGSICRLASGRDGVALQPGTYFIALGDRSREAVPDWSSIAFVRNEGAAPALVQSSIVAKPVSFEYLVLSVAPLA